MDRSYLDWNIVNWITVFLMASLGSVIVGAALVTLRQMKSRAE